MVDLVNMGPDIVAYSIKPYVTKYLSVSDFLDSPKHICLKGALNTTLLNNIIMYYNIFIKYGYEPNLVGYTRTDYSVHYILDLYINRPVSIRYYISEHENQENLLSKVYDVEGVEYSIRYDMTYDENRCSHVIKHKIFLAFQKPEFKKKRVFEYIFFDKDNLNYIKGEKVKELIVFSHLECE